MQDKEGREHYKKYLNSNNEKARNRYASLSREEKVKLMEKNKESKNRVKPVMEKKKYYETEIGKENVRKAGEKYRKNLLEYAKIGKAVVRFITEKNGKTTQQVLQEIELGVVEEVKDEAKPTEQDTKIATESQPTQEQKPTMQDYQEAGNLWAEEKGEGIYKGDFGKSSLNAVGIKGETQIWLEKNPPNSITLELKLEPKEYAKEIFEFIKTNNFKIEEGRFEILHKGTEIYFVGLTAKMTPEKAEKSL
jgi:hypothetical protein